MLIARHPRLNDRPLRLELGENGNPAGDFRGHVGPSVTELAEKSGGGLSISSKLRSPHSRQRYACCWINLSGPPCCSRPRRLIRRRERIARLCRWCSVPVLETLQFMTTGIMKKLHEIRDAIHTFVHVDYDERVALDSAPVQRLRQIHQLAMSYLVYPGATHRRFEHSLGVMELSSRVFDIVTAPEHINPRVVHLLPELGQEDKQRYWRRVLRMAALFHDVGHLPFSHAAERTLLPEGWDHEKLTVAIIQSAEMENIWKSMTPPLRSSDISKLAVGPKKYKDEEYSDWEAMLAEIIVGDALGVDRMDYLLRDSHHAGVAYGRFDHYRLIDTLRILPQVTGAEETSIEPQLGVEEGGLHSGEAMLLARYFMFTQVYYHPIRRVYDIHLNDFLSATLPEGRFSTKVPDVMELTDVEVTQAMRLASTDTSATGHDAARRILQREHFKVVYEKNPSDVLVHPQPGEAIFKAAGKEFGAENFRRDASAPGGALTDYPVLERDGRIVSAHAKSDVLANLPVASYDYVFANPDVAGDTRKWLDSERQNILEQPPEPEED